MLGKRFPLHQAITHCPEEPVARGDQRRLPGAPRGARKGEEGHRHLEPQCCSLLIAARMMRQRCTDQQPCSI